MAYCEAADLLLDDTAREVNDELDRYCALGADEIDAAIGERYHTPVSISDPAVSRSAVLLLKNLNVFISTGRILMKDFTPTEGMTVHKYAQYLLDEAKRMLEAIKNGEQDLPGVPVDSGGDTPPIVDNVLIGNVDPTSPVEAFYNDFARYSAYNPFYLRLGTDI
jgi:hypothetical protein